MNITYFQNEVKNQHVHMFWAVLIAFAAAFIVDKYAFLVSIGFGFCIESYQFFYKKENLKLFDRILDLFFWGIGGKIGFYFFNF